MRRNSAAALTWRAGDMGAPCAHNLLFIFVFRPGEVCPSCGCFKARLIFPPHRLFALSVFVPPHVSPESAVINANQEDQSGERGLTFTCTRLPLTIALASR